MTFFILCSSTPPVFCGISRYRSDFLETFRLEDLKELLAAATLEGTRIKAADLIREMEEAELEESKAGGMTMNSKQGLIGIVYAECCM